VGVHPDHSSAPTRASSSASRSRSRPRDALRRLSWRCGHIRQTRTDILDAFFLHDERQAEGQKPFPDWVRDDYDEAALRRNFHANGLASLVNDWVLAHE